MKPALLQRLFTASLLIVSVGACDPSPAPDPDTQGEAYGRWRTLTDGPGGALLSVWGRSADDVYVVGGDPGLGSGPSALHLDRGAWSSIPTAGVSGTLWWVFGVSDTAIFMVGENGVILRHDPTARSTELEESGTDLTLYGVWGVDESQVWAVGGDPQTGQGVVLRRDEQGWTAVTDFGDVDVEGSSFFKVWGSSAEDVWIVGDKRSVLRYQQGRWSRPELGSEIAEITTFFTVHGDPTGQDVVSVGTSSRGYILEWKDGTSAQRAPEGTAGLTGVVVGSTPRGSAVAVGDRGLVLWRSPSGWVEDEEWPTSHHLHGVWIDPDAGVWAVGGALTGAQGLAGIGTLVHYGPVAPPLLFRGP